jgi:GrpB-like predicted nucleotidyltransferase (UPF0157 family)
MFDDEVRRIREALPEDLVARFEHVGSTSVPALAAKPVIDVQLSVASMTPVSAYAEPLASIGYDHRVDPWNDDHEFFSRQDADVYGGVNLHVCLVGSGWERGHLAFRDWLRAHPEDVRAYGDLKRELAERHPRDIVAYLDGKTGFIERITEAALRQV